MQESGRMLPYKKQGANGINNFAFDDFLSHELLVSNNIELMDEFKDIMDLICNIRQRLTILRESRDRLLPKLMNGEIEV